MKSLFQHIEAVRAKPQHVRRRVALSISGGLTGVIALVWFVGSFESGAFSIPASAYGAGADSSSVTVVQPNTSSAATGMAGAAAALPSTSTDAPAHIEIVSAPAATTSDSQEQTVIPF